MSNTPAIKLSELPAAHRAAVDALMQEVSALKEITKRQEHLIAELTHALYGKRSEKLTDDDGHGADPLDLLRSAKQLVLQVFLLFLEVFLLCVVRERR